MAKPSKRTIIGLAAAGVLTAGIAVPALSFAADPTPSPSSSSGTTGNSPKGDRHGPDDSKLADALAKELGVDPQKVKDALAKVRHDLRPAGAPGQGQGQTPPSETDRQAKLKERLDQAVKDGKLTQAEADAILKASAAGVLGGPGFGGGHRPGGQPAPHPSASK